MFLINNYPQNNQNNFEPSKKFQKDFFRSIIPNLPKNSVETGSSPGRKRLLLIYNALIHEEINQDLSPWSFQLLCEQTSNICIGIFLCNPNHSRSHCFSALVICYRMVFLFQYGVRMHNIFIYFLRVTIMIRLNFFQCNPKLSQYEFQGLYKLN